MVRGEWEERRRETPYTISERKSGVLSDRGKARLPPSKKNKTRYVGRRERMEKSGCTEGGRGVFRVWLLGKAEPKGTTHTYFKENTKKGHPAKKRNYVRKELKSGDPILKKSTFAVNIKGKKAHLPIWKDCKPDSGERGSSTR